MAPISSEYLPKHAKHAKVFQALRESIISGELTPGNPIPTQLELCKRYKVSRPTIGKALDMLEKKGLLTRKNGGSSYVKKDISALVNNKEALLGILIIHAEEIPDSLENSIFGSLVSGLSFNANNGGFGVLLDTSISGNSKDVIQKAQFAAERMVQQGVKGVFYVPTELTDSIMDVNAKVVDIFDNVGISVVLLDRDIYESPKRSKYDIIGINHERAACRLATHLVEAGCKRIDFITDDVSQASSIDERIAGLLRTLSRFSVSSNDVVHKLPLRVDEEASGKQLKEIIEKNKTDAFMCVNDLTASCVMRHVLNMGLNIPTDIKIVGFDDLPLASHLQVPLTTIKQPADVLAAEAFRTMLDRIDNSSMPPRDIMVLEDLIVRESS